jgi:hypothetical protein
MSEKRTGHLNMGSYGADWYRNYFSHMHEPSLYTCGDSNADPEFRFLWDRSMAQPVSVRLVEHSGGSGTLYVRVLRNGGMLPPVRAGEKALTWDEWLSLEVDKTVEVSPAQSRQLVNMFSRVLREQPKEEPVTTDGVDFIFESRVSGRYCLVDFRNEAPPDVRSLNQLLVSEIAGLPMDKTISADGSK